MVHKEASTKARDLSYDSMSGSVNDGRYDIKTTMRYTHVLNREGSAV